MQFAEIVNVPRIGNNIFLLDPVIALDIPINFIYYKSGLIPSKS